MFCIFEKKFENSKWPPFLTSEIFVENLERLDFTDILWIKNFAEIAVSYTVGEIQAFLCFAIFAKNLKIQNGGHFWWHKIFLKTGSATQKRYPVGQKFRHKNSI